MVDRPTIDLCGALCVALFIVYSLFVFPTGPYSFRSCLFLNFPSTTSIKPAVRPDSSWMWGYIVSRKPITWVTDGPFQLSPNCAFSPEIVYKIKIILPVTSTLDQCKTSFSSREICNLFILSNRGICTTMQALTASAFYSADNSYCGYAPSRDVKKRE